MNTLLFFFLLICPSSGSDVPNFYSTYTSARDASRALDKDLLVFFINNRCSRCDEAWKAFIKDTPATKQYVSTRLDADDFDGKVLFEKFELRETPSWVILAPGGEVKEQWSGGWKDTAGNPTMYSGSETQKQVATHMPKSDAKLNSTPDVNPTVSPKEKPASRHDSFPPSEKETENNTKIIASASDPSPNDETGYVLQAGYFGSEANAQKMLDDLKAKGFENFLIKNTLQNGSKFFRVVSDAYPSEVSANKAIPSLTGMGFKVTVKKTSEI